MKTNALRILMLTFIVSAGFPAMADTPSLERTGAACKNELRRAYPTENQVKALIEQSDNGVQHYTNPMKTTLGSFSIYADLNEEAKSYINSVQAVIKNCEKTCGGLPMTNPKTGLTARFNCTKEGGGIARLTPAALYKLIKDDTILASDAKTNFLNDAEAEDYLMSQEIPKPEGDEVVAAETPPVMTDAELDEKAQADAPVVVEQPKVMTSPFQIEQEIEI